MSNILIDLTQIPKQKTGFGVYAVNLVRHISEIDHKNRYTILIQDDEKAFDSINKDNFNFIKIYSKFFRILPFRFSFEQVIIPLYLVFKKIDIIKYPQIVDHPFAKAYSWVYNYTIMLNAAIYGDLGGFLQVGTYLF